MEIDLDKLIREVRASLAESLGEFLEGEGEDLMALAEEIATDLAAAIIAKDQDLIDEISDQVLLLVEAKRLRFAHHSQAAVKKVVAAIGRGALSILAAVA